MGVTVSLSTSSISSDDLQVLTQDLCNTVNAETDLSASLARGESVVGGKGDPITIGAIVLAFITSGAAVTLMTVLKSYVERNSTLEIELDAGDGKKLKISAENLSNERFQQTVGLAQQLVGGPT